MSTERAVGDAHDVAELFDLLNDETRVRIVGELYRHGQQAPEEPSLTFSALYTGVDAEDSGRFNYHLRRLRGVLVAKREEGYVLSPLGTRLGRLVVEDDVVPIPV